MDITKEQVKRQLEVLTKIKELFIGQEKEVILRGIELVKKYCSLKEKRYV